MSSTTTIVNRLGEKLMTPRLCLIHRNCQHCVARCNLMTRTVIHIFRQERKDRISRERSAKIEAWSSKLASVRWLNISISRRLIANLADRADDAGSDDSGEIINLHRSWCESHQPGRSQIRRDDYRLLLNAAQLSHERRRVHLYPVSRILRQHAAHTSIRNPTCWATRSILITSIKLLWHGLIIATIGTEREREKGKKKGRISHTIIVFRLRTKFVSRLIHCASFCIIFCIIY